MLWSLTKLSPSNSVVNGMAFRKVATSFMQDWFSLLLTGLGVSFSANIWIGGTILALAGASVAMRSDPQKDERELWLVFLSAFCVAHVAAIIGFWLQPSFSPQIVMFTAGFLSRKVVRLALRVAGLMEARGDNIADRVLDRVLPPRPGSGNVSPPGNHDNPQNPNRSEE